MTHSEYTQHADPAVIRRLGTRKTQFPEGVELIRMIHGKINGEETLLAVTTDGIYLVDPVYGGALKIGFQQAEKPMRRSTDRDYRPLWIALVGVATALAFLATFQ